LLQEALENPKKSNPRAKTIYFGDFNINFFIFFAKVKNVKECGVLERFLTENYFSKGRLFLNPIV
jgi:hypothetical protein